MQPNHRAERATIRRRLAEFPGLLAGDSPMNDWIHGVQP